jgi:LPS-assembly lipoprotein
MFKNSWLNKHLLKHRLLLGMALASTLMLSACGFHLRTSVLGNDLPFRSIYISVAKTSPLGAELRRNIRGSGELEIKEDPEDAEATLDVLSETRDKVILSVNSQGRVREYVLRYTATIRVKDNQNRILLAPTTISLKRDLSYNETEVLAKESEETMLYRDMQSDLVQQILRRLAAIKTTAGTTTDAASEAATPAPAAPVMQAQ